MSVFYYIYILKNKDSGKLYTGFTNNLKRRVFYHTEGRNKYTAKLGEWNLIYAEAYICEKDAREREKFLKSGRGREVIRKQLCNTLLLSMGGTGSPPNRRIEGCQVG